MTTQLSLTLSLRDDATFENFLPGGDPSRNGAVAILQQTMASAETLVYLWGGLGSGASHLLQSACHYFLAQGKSAFYLPLAALQGSDPQSLLQGMEEQELVCLDNIEIVCGNPLWEEALFNLYNRIRAKGHRLVVSADSPPRGLNLMLPDLRSRLSSGLIFHLSPYSDDEKRQIICFRSARRGIKLDDDVAAFILNRGSRELSTLMAYIAELDRASLQAKRKWTIPFVKQTFGW